MPGRIRAAFTKAFVTPDGTVEGNSQTGYLLALRFDLVPRELRAAVTSHLIDRIKDRDWHLSTGFLGVNLLLPTLSDVGSTDVAYRLLQNTTYPSLGLFRRQRRNHHLGTLEQLHQRQGLRRRGD